MISAILVLIPLVSGSPLPGHFSVWNHPAVVAHHQPAFVGYQKPAVVAKYQPAVINYHKPAVVTNYKTPVVSHYKPAVVNYQTKPLVGYSSGNIIKQTRYQADSLKQTLGQLKKDPVAGKYIDQVITGSACLNNLDD